MTKSWKGRFRPGEFPEFFPRRQVDPATGCLAAAKEGRAVNFEPLRVYCGTVLFEETDGVPGEPDAPAEEKVTAEASGRLLRVWSYGLQAPSDAKGPDGESKQLSFPGLLAEIADGDVRIYGEAAEQADEGTAPFGEAAEGGGMPPRKTAAGLRFLEDGYIRLEAEGYGTLPGPLRIAHPEEALRERERIAPPMRAAVRDLAERVEAVGGSGDLTLFLVADSHYAVNGNWETTAKDLKAAARKIRPDGVVHLGDLTEGHLPKAVTERYAGYVLRDLGEVSDRVFVCIGNHDVNGLGQKKEAFTKAEALALYSGRDRESFYEDFPGQKLRLYFLASFDPSAKTEEKQFGFSLGDRLFVKRTLGRMPKDWHAVVFSHAPLLGEMHVLGTPIRGGEKLLRILAGDGRVLAFVHGHNHRDGIAVKDGLPVISVGCSFCPPNGSIEKAGVPARQPGTVSEDLWDVMRIRGDGSGIDLLRFGAGEDRQLCFLGKGGAPVIRTGRPGRSGGRAGQNTERSAAEVLGMLAAGPFAVFGTGYVSKVLCLALKERGLLDRVSAFVVTDPKGKKTVSLTGPRGTALCGDRPERPLLSAGDFLMSGGPVPLIAAVHPSVWEEVSSLPCFTGRKEESLFVYPYLPELLYGEPVGERVLTLEEILAGEDRSGYWIAVRYGAARGYLAGRREDEVYRKAIALFSSEDTAKKRLERFHGLIDTIRRDGFDPAHPILLDESGRIIDGLHRIALARCLGTKALNARIYRTSPLYDRVLDGRNFLTEAYFSAAGFTEEEIRRLRLDQAAVFGS